MSDVRSGDTDRPMDTSLASNNGFSRYWAFGIFTAIVIGLASFATWQEQTARQEQTAQSVTSVTPLGSCRDYQDGQNVLLDCQGKLFRYSKIP